MARQPATTEATGADEACCGSSVGIGEDGIATDVGVLSAMSSETRYEALRLIAGAPDGLCVCEIHPTLGVSQGAVSQALSRLHSAGLVDRRKEGRWRYYSATDPARRLLDTLDDLRGEADA